MNIIHIETDDNNNIICYYIIADMSNTLRFKNSNDTFLKHIEDNEDTLTKLFFLVIKHLKKMKKNTENKTKK